MVPINKGQNIGLFLASEACSEGESYLENAVLENEIRIMMKGTV